MSYPCPGGCGRDTDDGNLCPGCGAWVRDDCPWGRTIRDRIRVAGWPWQPSWAVAVGAEYRW